MKWLRLVSSLLILLSLACQAKDNSETNDSSNDQTLDAQYVLQTLNGADFDAKAELKGKIVVVDFWATWCRPCIEEIPAYNKFYSKFKAENFEMLGVTLDSGEAARVKTFVEKMNINYPIYMGNVEFASSFGGILAMPTTFILDENWNIVKKYVGAMPGKTEEMQEIVEQLLSKLD